MSHFKIHEKQCVDTFDCTNYLLELMFTVIFPERVAPENILESTIGALEYELVRPISIGFGEDLTKEDISPVKHICFIGCIWHGYRCRHFHCRRSGNLFPPRTEVVQNVWHVKYLLLVRPWYIWWKWIYWFVTRYCLDICRIHLSTMEGSQWCGPEIMVGIHDRSIAQRTDFCQVPKSILAQWLFIIPPIIVL